MSECIWNFQVMIYEQLAELEEQEGTLLASSVSIVMENQTFQFAHTNLYWIKACFLCNDALNMFQPQYGSLWVCAIKFLYQIYQHLCQAPVFKEQLCETSTVLVPASVTEGKGCGNLPCSYLPVLGIGLGCLHAQCHADLA